MSISSPTTSLVQYVRVGSDRDVPPPTDRAIDIALLDMNHRWPNMGHDGLVDGHRVELDWTYGATTEDRYVDVPPYRHDPHLKLRVESFVTTSIGLIIEAA